MRGGVLNDVGRVDLFNQHRNEADLKNQLHLFRVGASSRF
jgi:hypothetical protein